MVSVVPSSAPSDVPTSLYHHPDPLLRRLRLESPSGLPLTDTRAYFADVKVVVFYFGGAWGVDAGLGRGLHKDLTKLVMSEPKSLCLIYVSTDSKESEIKAVLQGLPWVRMTFHDNSDFAPIASSAPPAVTELLRGEDFVSASELEEYEMPSEGYADDLQYEYARPLSRAALTAHFGAMKTPTLAVYHPPTHKILSYSVPPSTFRPGSISRYFSLWKDGRTSGIQARAVWDAMRLPLLMALAAGLFHLYCWVYGPEANPLLHLQNLFDSRFQQPPSTLPFPPTVPLVSAASAPSSSSSPSLSALSSTASSAVSSASSHVKATLAGAARQAGEGLGKTLPTVKVEALLE